MQESSIYYTAYYKNFISLNIIFINHQAAYYKIYTTKYEFSITVPNCEPLRLESHDGNLRMMIRNEHISSHDVVQDFLESKK